MGLWNRKCCDTPGFKVFFVSKLSGYLPETQDVVLEIIILLLAGMLMI